MVYKCYFVSLKNNRQKELLKEYLKYTEIGSGLNPELSLAIFLPATYPKRYSPLSS